MKAAIYAKNLEELQVKSLGYHHDHCTILYFGKTSYLPNTYSKYINKVWDYIFVYEEDIPILIRD